MLPPTSRRLFGGWWGYPIKWVWGHAAADVVVKGPVAAFVARQPGQIGGPNGVNGQCFGERFI